MALLVNATSLPFIILFSLPLFFTAIFTTSLAVSTLFIRASVVYVESVPSMTNPYTTANNHRLFLALLQSALHPLVPHPHPQHLSTAVFASPAPSTRTTRRSSLAQQQHTPQLQPQRPLAVRDYESVGGWVASDSLDTSRWEAMTARLELPAMSPSLSTSVVRRSKSASLTTPARMRREGWASPEGYFAPVFTAGGGPSGVLEGSSSADGSQVVSRRNSNSRDTRVRMVGFG